MSEMTTFFRERGRDTGDTYQFRVKTDKEWHFFAVYCRQSLAAEETFTDQQISNKELEERCRKVGEAVTKRGGGLIVRIWGNGTTRRLETKQVPANMYQPSARFVLLKPGLPAYFVDMPVSEEKIPLGSHVIMPVDRIAEEQLEQFVALLPWLSRDVEALVLTALRRPSLDERLDYVESRYLEMSEKEKEKEQAGNWWSRRLSQLRRAGPMVVGYALAGIIVLLLAIIVFLWHDTNSKVEKALGVVGATGATGSSGDTGSTGPTGFTGSTDSMSSAGATGTTGTTGSTSATGVTGAAGATSSVVPKAPNPPKPNRDAEARAKREKDRKRDTTPAPKAPTGDTGPTGATGATGATTTS